MVERYKNVHLWVLLCLIVTPLGGCAPQSEGLNDGSDAFVTLHRNLYAVQSDDPDGLYSDLENIFSGEALTQAYLNYTLMLESRKQHGVEIDILSVSYQKTEVLGVGMAAGIEGVWVGSQWEVAGEVRHRKHRHGRLNHYEGQFFLCETDGGPRIFEQRMGDVGGTIIPEAIFLRMTEKDGSALSPSELLHQGAHP